jgi:hypothetical protein
MQREPPICFPTSGRKFRPAYGDPIRCRGQQPLAGVVFGLRRRRGWVLPPGSHTGTSQNGACVMATDKIPKSPSKIPHLDISCVR